MTINGGTFGGNMAAGEAADNGGGGIFNNGGTLVVNSAVLAENTASSGSGSGGGLLSTNGSVTIGSATFRANAANRAGGGIEIIEGTLTMTGTDFDANTTGDSPGNGGALHVSSSAVVTVTGGSVTGNTAAREGGGFWNQQAARMTVTGTTFTGNTAAGNAADDGGGALFNNGGTMRLIRPVIVRNTATGTAGSGGGILNLGGTLRISGGIVDTNSANRAGGGIEDARGIVQMDSVMVRGNSIAVAAPGNGGGFHSGGGTVSITNSSFLGNTAVEGGGIWVAGQLSIVSTEGGDMFVMDNVATGDAATNGGGGVFMNPNSTLTMIGVMVDDNSATGTAGSGGGVFLSDNVQATITGGTVSGNSANRAGGGIEIANDAMNDGVASLTLDGVEVDDNTIAVAAPGNGGGIHSGGGALVIMGGSVSSNTAVEGGGVWSNGLVTIQKDDDDDDTAINDNTPRATVLPTAAAVSMPKPEARSPSRVLPLKATRPPARPARAVASSSPTERRVTMTDVDVEGNSANRAGGGIEVADDARDGAAGTLVADRCRRHCNTIATANPGNGGGLHVGGAERGYDHQKHVRL